MNTLTDLTENFGTLYHPKSALIFYQTLTTHPDCYVESFDMDKDGNLINAHPLTVREANVLAKSLTIESGDKKPFLKSNGIIGSHILQIDPVHNGIVIWFSKAQSRDMFFVENLDIPNGKANVPPMLWVANRNKISVYALKTGSRPTEKTPLYHAPFFNVHSDGAVCMGTVDVRIKKTASLEEFTTAWENYFFNSYFSHLMQSHNPIKGNPVSIWKKLINTDKHFPKDVLVKANQTLKNLLR
ncbi:PRTRC system protein B [Pedobacter sp. ISL-68]|uniref:prokaryotic E2 ligase family D protein n=1 Tax=unclassified Pedobacter TaxID=2628915 RepID=UPI001BEB3C51|nr:MULTISPECIES: prokaryotic E2 ligase family D protein [unclassified Pedobacter]MBT2559855.1 PRTRC system protein B [Pedobacter sp. ISL-64]MBT2592160.1 PRTRC system protein B [Pedobacter sp. ISL-68]